MNICKPDGKNLRPSCYYIKVIAEEKKRSPVLCQILKISRVFYEKYLYTTSDKVLMKLKHLPTLCGNRGKYKSICLGQKIRARNG